MTPYILEAKHVNFTYPQGETSSLKDLSLSVRKGSRTAVMGANGSGKSTFFLCCNGILRPDDGQILYKGEPLSYRKKNLLDLRSKVGIVFQNPDTQLFSASVYQEISFGILNLGTPKEQAEQEVRQIMDHLGISSFSHRPAHALSGGQKKQVALADILVMKPELLILDEPFAALDPLHSSVIRTLIDDLGREEALTVVTATHDTGFALDWADEVILFQNGRVLCQGSPDRVLTNEQLMQETHLEVPPVVRMFRCLTDSGILNPALPCPRNYGQLEAYIRREGAGTAMPQIHTGGIL